ncbi:MAG: hypothetical protein M1821_002106 [Bathelium mastoideum]|nr:MAG: hypothetical protein M1821_002106 [Bathelium mastoideum]
MDFPNHHSPRSYPSGHSSMHSSLFEDQTFASQDPSSHSSESGQNPFPQRRGHSDSIVARQPPASLHSSTTMTQRDLTRARYRRRISLEGNGDPHERAGAGVDGDNIGRAGDALAERKRRLTTPSSPGRRGSGMEDAGIRMLQSQQLADLTASGEDTRPAAIPDDEGSAFGGSQETPVDLTNDDPSPTPGPVRQIRERPRRGSEVVLPKWQPDSEVSSCPVCGTAFNFFFRKHHCR